MKKYLLALVISVSLFATQSKAQTAAEGSPSDIATKFTKAFLSLDVKEAAKYATSATAAMLNQVAPAMESQKASIPDSLKNLLSSAKITTQNEKINNDSATVSLTTTFPKPVDGEKEKTEIMKLVKEAGSWKVILDMGAGM